MTIAIPLDHMQVAFHMSIQDAAGDAVCTLGVDCSASADTPQGDLDTVADAWGVIFSARGGSAQSYLGATAIRTSAGGPQSLESPRSLGGAISGAILPANCAILVQKLTGFAGKKNRGRLFWPGVQVGVLVGSGGNMVTPSVVGAFQSQFDTFLTTLVGASLLPVIFHQTGVADPPRVITSFKVLERLATQRGRLRD